MQTNGKCNSAKKIATKQLKKTTVHNKGNKIKQHCTFTQVVITIPRSTRHYFIHEIPEFMLA